MGKSESKYVTFQTIEGDILEAKFTDGITVDLTIAKEMLKVRKEFTENTTVKALVDVKKAKGFTKEARTLMSSKEGHEHLQSAALITGSAVSNILINFFIKINLSHQPIPIRLFTDREKAIDWLTKQ